ncbi:MAG: macro domain-containing protein [Planctomycetes bacterium]|nr:macro domain-containing protein [Planctomycetota bacterium]NUQ35442.1 macro domain-containing protein [Planctomycetaceae bacterium]
MNKDAIQFAVGSLLDSPAEAIINEVNEDLIFSPDAFSSLRDKIPDDAVTECLKIGRIAIGTATATSAGRLKAKHIIHVATCGFDGKSDEMSIIESLRHGLDLTKQLGIKSIAIPEVGRQTSDIPLKRLAELLLSECLRHNDREITLETVYFRLGDKKAVQVYQECLRHI